MIKIYSSENIANVAVVKAFLESNGVTCQIRNQFLAMGRGELPPIQCWPELWVDAGQAEAAGRLLEEAETLKTNSGEGWTCPNCGEQIEGQFGVCWNCGAEHPEVSSITGETA